MKPTDEDTLERWPVSKRVNSSRAADVDPTLIEIEAEGCNNRQILTAHNFFAPELHRQPRPKDLRSFSMGQSLLASIARTLDPFD